MSGLPYHHFLSHVIWPPPTLPDRQAAPQIKGLTREYGGCFDVPSPPSVTCTIVHYLQDLGIFIPGLLKDHSLPLLHHTWPASPASDRGPTSLSFSAEALTKGILFHRNQRDAVRCLFRHCELLSNPASELLCSRPGLILTSRQTTLQEVHDSWWNRLQDD